MDFRFSSEDNRFHEKEAKEAFVVESYGSVEGVLEASPCEGEGMFVIRKALNGELVQCHIRDDLIRQAKDALGRRVNVFGEKLVSKDGKSRAISGRKMRVLPRQEELPPLEFFRGIAPDMTGGLPSEVYVKKRFYGAFMVIVQALKYAGTRTASSRIWQKNPEGLKHATPLFEWRNKVKLTCTLHTWR